ncbi:MAG: tetratricopeptide repeat protein [Planctomycetes bacterium]|nr:tetratricopeptide repeat protein [Planctomycetota bacterium]
MSRRTFWLVLGVLCLVGLLLRLAILEEFLRVNPIAEQPWTDGQVYWDTAGRMAAGEWVGDTPFLAAPLYPYFLGVIRWSGGGLKTVYAIQLVLHLATVVLIAWIVRLRAGPGAGLLAAGLFLALTEPAVTSMRILGNTGQLLLVGLVWWRWVVLAQGKTQPWLNVVLTGCLLGLLSLSFPPAILLVPAYGLWLWCVGRWRVAGLGRGLAGSFCALLLIAPATAHNAWQSGEFIPITAHGGITLRHGNALAADGTLTSIPGVTGTRQMMHRTAAHLFKRLYGHAGGWREIDQHFRRTVFAFWREDPARAAGLFARKLYWFLTARNYDEMMPVALEREYGIATRVMLAPLGTAWLMGAALAGLLATLQRPVRWAPEWLLLGLALLTTVLFFYSPRYRLPAVPVLCGLAAYAVVEYRHVWYPRWLLVALCLVPLPLYIVNRVVGFDTTDYMRASYTPLLSIAQAHAGNRRAEVGELEAAEQRYRAALRVAPDNPMAHRQLGALYIRLGRPAEALRELELALRCYPSAGNPAWDQSRAVTLQHVYNACIDLGRNVEAQRALTQALELQPYAFQVRLALAWSLATCPDEAGRDGPEALRQAEEALSIRADDEPEGFIVLAAAQAAAGCFEDATATATRAAEIAGQRGMNELVAELGAQAARYRQGEVCVAGPRRLQVPLSAAPPPAAP